MDPRRRERRVLIVDDDRDFAEGLAAHWRSEGMLAELATDALTALAIVAVRRPDLICLDVEMPSGNGLSIGELLAADSVAQRIPVIYLTGRTDVGTIRRCGELRGHYLHKSPDVWRQVRTLGLTLLQVPEPAARACIAPEPLNLAQRSAAAIDNC